MMSRPLITILLVALPAMANDGGSGFTSWYNNVWGNSAARVKLAKCEAVDDANETGFVGYANNLFCHLERDLNITGPTAAGGVTGQFMFASIEVHVHVEVAGEAGSGAYNGYDHEAKMWGCAVNGPVDCTNLTDYKKFAYVTWSYNADKTVSKGVMVHDQYIQNGTTGLYIKTTWDTGTSTGTKSLTTLEKSSNYLMLASHVTAGDKVSATIVTYNGSNGDGLRMAMGVDYAAGVAGSKADFHIGSTTATKGDTATLNCYTRVASGDDYDMAPENTAGACDSLPTVTYPNVSTDDLKLYTTSDVTGSSGGWTAMSTNPAAL
jgi:hypothetical protein